MRRKPMRRNKNEKKMLASRGLLNYLKLMMMTMAVKMNGNDVRGESITKISLPVTIWTITSIELRDIFRMRSLS
jgi:hypothetical protein